MLVNKIVAPFPYLDKLDGFSIVANSEDKITQSDLKSNDRTYLSFMINEQMEGNTICAHCSAKYKKVFKN